jgi:hypothetical protein
MNVRARRFSIAVCGTFGVLSIFLLSDVPGSAQAPQVSRSFAQGTHLFRRLLYDLHLQPLRSIPELFEEPADKLLIILGETDYLLPRINLKDFVERGGAVLLATDRDCRNLLRPFGVRVRGDLVVCAEAKYTYKDTRDCIFVQESPGKDVPLFENLSLDDDRLSRVATNRPGYLLPDPNCKLPVLARFPRGCWPMGHDIVQGGSWARRNERIQRELFQNRIFSFAVGGAWDRGRILVLSDHSVFINAMMWQPDIDNFDFAYNCVNWLTAKGRRTHVLFLEEGRIQETFQIPLKEPPAPPLPPLKAVVETIDKGLGEIEKDNTFNRVIHKAVTDVTAPGDKWVQAVVLMSTLALGVFGLSRLTQARHRREKVSLPADSDPGQRPAATSLLEQRHQAMLRDRNLWESAQALARQGLESVLGPQVRAHLPQPAGGTPPLLPSWTNGSWWRTWRLRRRFHRLWRLAYGTEPVRISSRQLRRLGREIEQLNALLPRVGPPMDGQVKR